MCENDPILCFPRLHDALEPFDASMAGSYANLANFVTELKMDHQDGKLKSDRLDALLVLAFISLIHQRIETVMYIYDIYKYARVDGVYLVMYIYIYPHIPSSHA